jgi:hypothetical protein
VSKNLFKLSSSLTTRNSLGGVESEEEEFETQSIADSVDSDQSSTIQVIRRTNSAQKTQQERVQHALLTPKDTPTPTTPTPEQISAPSQARPRQEIVGDVGELNIIDGTRTRKPSKRHEAYLTDLAAIDITCFDRRGSGPLSEGGTTSPGSRESQNKPQHRDGQRNCLLASTRDNKDTQT